MTPSSRDKMKIKFPSPAQMIDDGKGRHSLWGMGEKQPGNAWRWEMLSQKCCAGSCPTQGHPSLCCSLTPSILACAVPRESCPSPWPLGTGTSSLPLFLPPHCTLWDWEFLFPQQNDLKSRGANPCSQLHKGNSCLSLRGFALSIHPYWSCSHHHFLIVFDSHFLQLLIQLLQSPNFMIY